ncbi:MAG: hypothetical protein PHP45_07530 [Elusimicrobiales bacterium]|nr:hypothetical protein [Elusimicrobiales bacterium]
MKKFAGLLLCLLSAFVRAQGAAQTPPLARAGSSDSAKKTSSAITASMLESGSLPGAADMTALGAFGPFGAYGPLGTLGPIGNNSWNSSSWMNMAGKWSSTASLLAKPGGPLSDKGPLGRGGPLGDSYSSFPENYKAGGAWAVFGPAGPLGALGPLGPLGPLGAHGFKAGADGGYYDGEKSVAQVSVPYGNGSARTFGLVEVVTASSAKKAVNDTSVMILGELDRTGGMDSFKFISRENQYVSVVAVPEKQLDGFQLKVTQSGQTLAVSDSATLVNWAHFFIPANAQFTVTVRLGSTAQMLSHTYRLAVTGSTSYVLK